MSTTETSANLLAQVQEIRDRAVQLRTEREAVLSAAQAEADRLRAEADRVLQEAGSKAGKLSTEAANTERSAEPLEERAFAVQAAEQLADVIPAAEAHVVALYQELETLGETISGLQERIDQRGIEREEIGIELAKARDAGDVDQVVAARNRLSAVDEVTQALDGQKRVADARVVEIGTTEMDGQLAKAAKRVLALQGEQRRVLNWIDPTRPEAQVDELAGRLQDYVSLVYFDEKPEQLTSMPAPFRPNFALINQR
ncbi:hypothetical protein [Streptacidiphilus anmyonensis]|uniref:hypothetical protein n=1 Tax=Streptacidiphilus anmyonensis TaxID=405782 RepID=UPI0005A9E51A|nr:hypothetical protein [Streptacidiphilus anmyonensis]